MFTIESYYLLYHNHKCRLYECPYFLFLLKKRKTKKNMQFSKWHVLWHCDVGEHGCCVEHQYRDIAHFVV